MESEKAIIDKPPVRCRFHAWDTLRKQTQREVLLHPEDRISILPEEILFRILSLLPFKDAIATSVLSTLWVRLCISWFRFIPQLDLDNSTWIWEKVQVLGGFPDEVLAEERVKYIEWVNEVLRYHKGSKLEVFRVGFDLCNCHSQRHVNNWLSFALARKVERLELDFSEYGRRVHSPRFRCAFPGEIHAPSSAKPYFTRDSVSSLRTLSLKSLHITDETLSYLISNCPLLECLIVHDSGTLENVEVCGPSLALRHLEICNGSSLKSIMICDTNLRSFKFCSRHQISLLLLNNPLLIDLDIGDALRPSHRFATISMFSNLLSQLEFLTVRCPADLFMWCTRQVPELKLKELVLELSFRSERGVLACTWFLKASPFLKKLVLKLRPVAYTVKENEEMCIREICEWAPITKTLEHLKVAVVEGYYGGRSDFAFVCYILNNAVALEELIIDPRSDMRKKTGHCAYEKIEKARRDFAKKQFEGKMPSQVRLTIL